MTRRLGLRAGDWVEVRSADEILSTLDEDGCLEALPFMPEMLLHCGRRFRVHRRADKTCDTIGQPISRRMTDAVHLEDLRCDGSAHGGCQAQCLLFWKEAWLRRVPGPDGGHPRSDASDAGTEDRAAAAVALLQAAARLPPDPPEEPEGRWMCQATELQRATTPLRWWEPGQYWRELRSGNVPLRKWMRAIGHAAFNSIQRRRGGAQRPSVRPRLTDRTPTRKLDLEPGELVRIRSKEEIEATLDQAQKNRGLYFDVEMVPYCGRTVRVKDRVERIVDERTGRMLHFRSDCIMLESVTCGGCLSHDRLFCPRSIYSFWREIWLERVEGSAPSAVGDDGEAR